jgi:translation elongation factor EF-Tu-like GTPase
MPKKSKAARKGKKTAAKKSTKTATRKLKKKALKKKSSPTKKSARKKALKKAARKKTAKKKTTVRRAQPVMPPIAPLVEPGPPSLIIPPVEEPMTPKEEAIGTVTHYYSHLNVAVIQVNKGTLKVGDSIRFKGHTTDLSQTVESMEYEHQHIDEAAAGISVGIKVADHVREHDIVYLVK